MVMKEDDLQTEIQVKHDMEIRHKANYHLTSVQRRGFFDLLHKARELKAAEWVRMQRKVFLAGMCCAFIERIEDAVIADQMRDYWKCQESYRPNGGV